MCSASEQQPRYDDAISACEKVGSDVFSLSAVHMVCGKREQQRGKQAPEARRRLDEAHNADGANGPEQIDVDQRLSHTTPLKQLQDSV